MVSYTAPVRAAPATSIILVMAMLHYREYAVPEVGRREPIVCKAPHHLNLVVRSLIAE